MITSLIALAAALLVDSLKSGEPRTLYLVACAAQKHDQAMPAGDIYVSDLFSKARAYVEAQGAPWLILSAHHGLLHPETVIEPYNVTLNAMKAPERRAWAARVFEQMAELQLRPGDRVIFLAGRKYRDDLIPKLEAQGVQVEVPMLGLGIGHQKQWLKLMTDNDPPALTHDLVDDALEGGDNVWCKHCDQDDADEEELCPALVAPPAIESKNAIEPLDPGFLEETWYHGTPTPRPILAAGLCVKEAQDVTSGDWDYGWRSIWAYELTETILNLLSSDQQIALASKLAPEDPQGWLLRLKNDYDHCNLNVWPNWISKAYELSEDDWEEWWNERDYEGERIPPTMNDLGLIVGLFFVTNQLQTAEDYTGGVQPGGAVLQVDLSQLDYYFYFPDTVVDRGKSSLVFVVPLDCPQAPPSAFRLVPQES